MKTNQNLLATIALLTILIPGVANATPLGYWRFEEGVAGNPATAVGSVLDATNLNHGNPSGSPIYQSDVPVTPVPKNALPNGLSLGFDGIDDTVLIPTDIALDGAGSFTVEFWMRSADTRSGQHLLVDKSHGFVDTTGWLFQSRSGTGVIDFGLGAGGSFPTVSSLADLFDDEWHHLAGTYDGNEIEFFVDGVSQGKVGAGIYDANTRDIRIGSASNNGRFFSGRIDELRISDGVLTQGQFLNAVPEPAVVTLFGSCALALMRRRRDIGGVVQKRS